MDKPWNPCLFPWNGCLLPWNGWFFAVDWGTLKNAKLQAPNFGSAYLKWKKVKNTTKWWCTKKRENKPSSLINRLCQNSCKINRLWKSRVNRFNSAVLLIPLASSEWYGIYRTIRTLITAVCVTAVKKGIPLD